MPFTLFFWLLTGAAPMVQDPWFPIRGNIPSTALTPEQFRKILDESEKEMLAIPLPKLPMQPAKPMKPSKP